MDSKCKKLALFSSVVLAAVASSSVFADETASTVAASPAAEASNAEASASPQVTVIDQQVTGNQTLITSEVTSKALEEAKQKAKESGLEATETDSQNQPSVEAADADNKQQAENINTALTDYEKAKADYQNQLEQYQKDLAAYETAKAEYDALKKAYDEYNKEVAAGIAAGRVETAQGLVFINEPEATLSIEGVDAYLQTASREQHATDSILEQFNTDKYTSADFSIQNPYDPNQDTWFLMKVGDKVTVTYDNILYSSYNDKKISKVISTYQLNSSTNDAGTALVQLFHDPTKTIFIGAQTSQAGRSDQISVTMQITFYDEAGNVIDLSNNNAIMSLSSLNHWKTSYGDHVEKVQLGENEFIQIPGSSISLHGDAIYSENDNQYKNNGATFDGDGEDGWDAINPDGKPRSATAYYGAGAMTYKGRPFTFTVGGNDQYLPTTIWFATNSAVAVPKDPGDGPTPPAEPILNTPVLTWHRNFVVEQNNLPEEPTPPQTPNPTPPANEEPTPPTKTVVKRATPVPYTKSTGYQPILPETGDRKDGFMGTLGLVTVSFAIATLFTAHKRRKFD